MNTLVLWLIPPAIGALIGYITNAVAIKMLFRPLTEKRIWKFRIPFTPGILPRQRHKLAENIGNMVSRELLAESIVRDRLLSSEFRFTAERAAASLTARLLDKPLADIADKLSPPTAINITESLETAPGVELVGRLWKTLSQSEAFTRGIVSFLENLLSLIGKRSLDSFLNADYRQALTSFTERIFSKITQYVKDGQVEQKIVSFLNDLNFKPGALSLYLPPDLDNTFALLGRRLFPVLTKALLDFLHLKTIRDQLESQGRLFLKDVLLRLNVFQRFFLSATQYDKTLTERMPEIIDDLVEKIDGILKSDETPNAFTEALSRAVKRLLALSPAEAAVSLGIDQQLIAASLNRLIIWFVSDPSRQKKIAEVFLAKIDYYAGKPIALITEQLFSETYEETAKRISEAARKWITERKGISWLVETLIKEFGDRTLGQLTGLVGDEKARLDRFLANGALSLLNNNLGAMLAGLDVKKIVVDRIDGLDMLSVERIILDVLADQLRWINVFGAILGALIGLSQVFISVFMTR